MIRVADARARSPSGGRFLPVFACDEVTGLSC